MIDLVVMSSIPYHLCVIKDQVYNMIPKVSKNHSYSHIVQDDVGKGIFLWRIHDKFENFLKYHYQF